MPDRIDNNSALIALRLTVNNHPGVMSHVCGLFARRAFNLEGILVSPVDHNSATCNILLLVNEDDRLAQMVSQVRKLHDVLDVRTDSANEDLLDWLRQAFPH